MTDQLQRPILQSLSGELLVERFHDLSRRILRCAHHSASTTTFLLDVSKMLLDSCGCDAVELEIREDGKAHLACCWRQSDQSIRVKALTSTARPTSSSNGEAREDLDLRLACRHALRASPKQRPPFLTEHGSYWVGADVGAAAATRSFTIESHAPELLNLADYPSLALIPFIIEDEKAGSLLLMSRQSDCVDKALVRVYERLAETIGIAVVFPRAQLALRERVKELSCLYRLSHLAEECDTLEDFLEGLVGILPEAWLHPEVAVAELTLDGRSFSSPGNDETWRHQTAPIIVKSEQRGSVKVGYVQQRPDLDEGPFLGEERILIDNVAREIGLIVERKEGEAEQLELQKQLRHTHRLATIGQLSAGVAHELNEPLGGILGFAQLLGKNPDLPDVARRDVEKIEAASLHAREVIKKLMIFAKQVQPKKIALDLNDVINESLSFLESRCKKDSIEVTLSLSDTLPRIYGDSAQLRQVVVNIVVNAIQAMPDGGGLTITTASQDNEVILRIEDTGVGMSEDVRKQVFLPFFSTKDVGQGTGLGLSVVHGIVISHHSSITVESEPGRGSRFEIRIPEATPEDSAEKE